MILVTGANGQLGTELRHLLDERNEEYVAVDVAEMDITDAEKVDEVFAEVKPSLVYHCAAYTAVDAAEVAVAVEVAGASDAVATAATLSFVVSFFSSAAALAAVPTMTSVPKSTEQTPTFNLRIENLLIRSLNKSFPI